jgi:hypothetical protein
MWFNSNDLEPTEVVVVGKRGESNLRLSGRVAGIQSFRLLDLLSLHLTQLISRKEQGVVLKSPSRRSVYCTKLLSRVCERAHHHRQRRPFE